MTAGLFLHIAALKGQFTSKSKEHIFLLTYSGDYPSRLFLCELMNFGDMSAFSGTTQKIELNEKKLNSRVSLKKSWMRGQLTKLATVLVSETHSGCKEKYVFLITEFGDMLAFSQIKA